MNINGMTIKNEKLERAIGMVKDFEAALKHPSKCRRFLERISARDMAISIMLGYTESLLEAAGHGNLNLDLTYDTLPNLMRSSGMMFAQGIRRGGHPVEELQIVEKTWASYLTLLAINEEGCFLRASMPEDSSPETIWAHNTWAGIKTVIANGFSKADFLGTMIGETTYEEGPEGRELDIQSGAVNEAYYSLTGKWLSDFGLHDLKLQFFFERDFVNRNAAIN